MVTASVLLIGLAAQFPKPAPQMAAPDPGPTQATLARLNNAIVAAWNAPNPTVRQFSQPIWKNFQTIRDAANNDVIPPETLSKLDADARALTIASQLFQIDARTLVELREVDNDLRIKAQAATVQFEPPPVPATLPGPDPVRFAPPRPAASVASAGPPGGRGTARPDLDRLVVPTSARDSAADVGGLSDAAGVGPSGDKHGEIVELAALRYAAQPAKAAPGMLVQASKWVKPVSIITKLQGQPQPNIDVWYIARGRVLGGVSSQNMRWLGKSQIQGLPFPWGSYLVYASAGPLPPVVAENQLTRIEVTIYPNIPNQAPLMFEVDAR